MFSVIIDLGFLSDENLYNASRWILTLLSKILSTIGLALTVSGITMRIRKAETVEAILNTKDKENVIRNILARKTNLDKYLEQKTNELYNIENRFFTNYSINVLVSEKDGKIIAKTEVTYFDNGRTKADKKLSAFFDKEDDAIDEFVIINPDDRNRFVSFKNSPDKKQIQNRLSGEYGVYENEYYVIIPREFQELERLEIHKKYTTHGSDHWIDIGTIFARPTSNVQITVNLEGDLIIKDEFVAGNPNHFKITNNITSYSFTCSGWISSYCGVCLLVAKNDKQ